MFSTKVDFIGKFKTGDNINHNLRIISYLYEVQEQSKPHQALLLRKPIIILLTSIIEAVLHDFLFRVKELTYEGVSNLSDQVVDDVRAKRHTDFEKFIAASRKHDFFDSDDNSFYKSLDELREVRNRIHIQNDKDYQPANESAAFTEKMQLKAEECLEKVILTMKDRHPRPEELGNFVSDFCFPWYPHNKSDHWIIPD